MLAKIVWLPAFGTKLWHAFLLLAGGHILAMAHFRLVCACNVLGKCTVLTPQMTPAGIMMLYFFQRSILRSMS